MNKSLADAINNAIRSKKYVIGITFVDHQGTLQHKFEVQNFKNADLLGSLKSIEKLGVKHLVKIGHLGKGAVAAGDHTAPYQGDPA